MKKVVFTITPNPALDLSGSVDDLKPNEKSYVFDEKRSPGGNAINVARILNRLRVPVVASGFLGGSTGEEVGKLLNGEKIKCNFVPIEGSTRINVTVSNQLDHYQTRLSFAGPIITVSEKKRLFTLVGSQTDISLLVIGGSLPQGFKPSDLIHLMRLAEKNKIRCVVDCPGRILADILVAKPLLIKPNLTEFQELTNCRVKTIGSVQKKAKALLEHAQMICVSSVEDGALLITRNGSFFGRIPPIEIRSTVGAGDSMVAAMVAQIFKNNKSQEQLLRWGLASSASTLMQSGTELGKASDIALLFNSTQVERVS